MRHFKYERQLQALPDCPPETFQEGARDGYRYVFSKAIHNSFDPVLVIKPGRAISWNDKQRCVGWALSFFTTADAAVANYENLKSTNPNIHKLLGDALAKGILAKADGVMSAPDARGHFSLHEYNGSGFASGFLVVRRLV